MKTEQLMQIRDEISALLIGKVDGHVEAEHELVSQAVKQLEQLTCMGGSTRAKGEAELVRLVQQFDDTRNSGFGPWPVSRFMMDQTERADAFRKALLACISAHKTGKYEPMVAAIEAAENLISDQN